MKIVILGGALQTWGGGIDFLRLIVRALLLDTENTYYLVLKQEVIYPKLSSKFLTKLIRSCLKRLPFIPSKDVGANFNDLKADNLKIINTKSIHASLRQIEPDVVLPSFEPIKNFPFVGYIYDCQHKKLPELFTDKEKISRDNSFQNILSNSNVVIVNAMDVKNDIYKYYKNIKSSIVCLPFAPFADADWFNVSSLNGIAEKLPKKYFCICNQFWKHKDHMTAIKALGLLIEKGIDDVGLVCTGNTHDHRFPKYFDELQNEVSKLNLEEKIIFTGYINKQNQIYLMRNSIALVQPTLSEGGPGGGAVCNAYSLGVRSLVSDIPVNRELPIDEDILYFKAKDAEDLAEKMMQVLVSPYESKSKEFLQNRNEEGMQKLNRALSEAMNKSVNIN